jgi:MalT-like TPR region
MSTLIDPPDQPVSAEQSRTAGSSAIAGTDATRPVAGIQDAFMANLRQALEHVNDAEWLQSNSPLEAVVLLSAAGRPPTLPAAPTLGIRALDDRLSAIWQDWESREKDSLQKLLWSAVRKVPPGKDLNHRALLMLTYFEDPRPKQGVLIRELAIGQSTFYRQLNSAIEALQRVLIEDNRPSLRLEAPAARDLIGRASALADCVAALKTGGVVNIIGASGLGKTSLAVNAGKQWPGGVFWYTFRTDVTDNAQHLIFSLALFMHQQGASGLWNYLLAKPQDGTPGNAMAMIRHGLETLRVPPLFCFDEADLLLSSELDDNPEHAQLRAMLEDFAESPRNGAPLMFVGQRLLLPPDSGRLFTLERMGRDDARAVLAQSGIQLDDAVLDRVMQHTRGNPLLLQLLAALHHSGEPVLSEPALLATGASLDWFLTRLRRRLAEKDLVVLDALCVFDTPAPADVWRRQARTIERLIRLGLVEAGTRNTLSIPVTVRDALYRRLSDDAREVHHLAAAQAWAERGAHTLAARHFVAGKRADLAIWTWHVHRDNEVEQGQTQTALRLFDNVRMPAEADLRDRRALALLLADLYQLAGRQEAGLQALNDVHWPAERASSARARELRANLLSMRGDLDNAVTEYRASLDILDRHPLARTSAVRASLARKMLFRVRDVAAARRDALLAKFDVDMLLGEIAHDTGDHAAAMDHFRSAQTAAQSERDPIRLAKISEVLAFVEARHMNAEAAVALFNEAARHFDSYGDEVNAMAMRGNNVSYAWLLARRHQDAIAPATAALDYFRQRELPLYVSTSEANLAEALAGLGQLDEAESFAMRSLAHEELYIRPYSLYVLGDICRQRKQFAMAESHCREAIAIAQGNHDMWAAIPAWRILGETLREWGRHDDARAALAEAIALCDKADFPSESAHLSSLAAEL